MTWERLPIKRLGDVFLGKMIQPAQKVATDVAAPYLRAAHIQRHGRIVEVDDKTMWFSREELDAHDLLADDVVIVEGGAGYGRSAVIRKDLDGWGFQNSIVRVRPRPAVACGRFIDYAIQSALCDGEIEASCFTATIPHFTADKVGSFCVPAPSFGEQRAIADYLDRETARIDTLIEEQRRLIETLQERRQAQISHEVLDGVPCRTSLRRLVDVIDCAHVTADFVDDDRRYPVASIRECSGSTVDLSKCQYTTPEFFELLRASGRAPRVGDLLFIRNVSVGLVSAVAPGTPEFAVGQETVLLRRNTNVDPHFLAYALTSSEVRYAIDGAMIGSTFKRINVSAIRALPVAVPPLEEQRRIAAYLDEQNAKIDALIAETETFIELSRERRSALITAAVTGQIDVREVA